MLSESQNIEYKESWRDEYLKWICGFANAQGGRIFIGVNDEKQVIGLPDAKKLMEDIPNKIVNYLGIVEDVNLLTEGEKEYIEIVVTPSTMREAICNAIVHRDYMGVHTQMKVYDDCIMLWNDGKLPEGIDQEKLFAEHASQPRNRNIANAFYKAGFIETWGRGINKIRQGLKKMGLPEPKIENHVSGTLIIIYRNGGVNGTNDTNNVGNMSETNFTERQRFILYTIKANPFVTGKEMSETLSVTQRTIERDLAAMQKAGIIRHEGKVNAGVWVVLEKPQKKD